jgi:hypothetical protein
MSDATTSSHIRPAGQRSWLKRLLTEPLFHFLAIAAVLFVAYRALNPNPGTAEQSSRIVLTEDDLRQLSITWLAQGRPAPTAEQMQHLVAVKVREEILYREALALGLDKDDTIVKRRLAQKMEFLAEDLSNIAEPSTQELKVWFEANMKRFELPQRVSFRHLYFSPDRHRERTQEKATTALADLAGKSRDATEASPLGDRFMFQDTYGDRTFAQVATLFGPEFARTLFTFKPGAWQGPVQSGYGWHLIWIDSMTPIHVPTFEEVEPSVKSEWVAGQREQSKRKMFEAMRTRYQVILPGMPANPADGKSSLAPKAGTGTSEN